MINIEATTCDIAICINVTARLYIKFKNGYAAAWSNIFLPLNY